MKSAAILVAAAVCSMSAPAFASDQGWDDASSVARNVLIGAALGIPALKGDWTGDIQAASGIVAAGAMTYGLKEAFPELRPDGSDRKSFPSGHTSVSFAAAASLENRYGWKVGIPAFAVATFVGFARVEAHKHHWYDSVAGAAIGTGTGLLLTKKLNDGVSLTPWAESKGGGVAFAMRF